jgi:hypothetical protein
MGDSNSWKPGSRPSGSAPSARSPAAGDKSAATGEKPVAAPDEFAGRSGRVVHDERGNAVWDWIKETSRIAIDSTSRLLKRLEVPELKMEDTQKNEELSLESERDAGGGYDPYGGSKSAKSPGPRSSGAARSSSAPSKGTASTRGSSNAGTSTPGGGYDPYGKSVTRKPSR